MRRVQRFIGTLLVAVCGVVAPLRAEVAVPPLTQPVTDLAGALSAADRAGLNQKLLAFSEQSGSQVAVLIVPTTQPETIEQYSIRVVDLWKLGRKQVDDGVLLVVAKNDRAVRIEVGRGLEGAIPDAIAKRIVEEIIIPEFRAGRFGDGISAGASAIIGLIRGEGLPAPQSGGGGSADIIIFLLLIAAFAVLNILVPHGPVYYGTGRRGRYGGTFGSPLGRGRGGFGGGGFSGGGGGFSGGGASGRW